MSGERGEQPWRPEETATVPLVLDTAVTVPIAGHPTVRMFHDPGRDPSQADHQPANVLAPPRPGELLRFGPGVPVPAAADAGLAAAIWHGATPPGEPARPRLVRWLLPLLVLIAVLAILLWQRSGSPLAVSGATVRPAPQSLTCGGTATITATLRTNGESGTITYRWKRSDGTVSDRLQQQVAKGSDTVDVVLLWAFHGQGTLNPTATLEVLSPNPVTAAATFAYACDTR